jgi:hypothetical protein
VHSVIDGHLVLGIVEKVIEKVLLKRLSLRARKTSKSRSQNIHV